MSDLATIVLPRTWKFAIGDNVIAVSASVSAAYTVIDRVSDLSGMACYRVTGEADGEPVEGWISKRSLEELFRKASSTDITFEGDHHGLG